MTPEEAISVSLEQSKYWRDRGVTADKAWEMLTGKTHSGGWWRVERWMARWLTSGDEERWAA